ncbi:hypothetical protein DN745_12805 [Bradymonas sediminis]|uniref:Uncharacterized protein n=1 Tax=Bradymonas sediminis TaxID=1548548 RepID=A0A2Z4FN88_9DELT|nr:hypothetical protein DN745_12805 [Bradymonas sediminis]
MGAITESSGGRRLVSQEGFGGRKYLAGASCRTVAMLLDTHVRDAAGMRLYFDARNLIELFCITRGAVPRE